MKLPVALQPPKSALVFAVCTAWRSEQLPGRAELVVRRTGGTIVAPKPTAAWAPTATDAQRRPGHKTLHHEGPAHDPLPVVNCESG
jgi:hypothetical protein